MIRVATGIALGAAVAAAIWWLPPILLLAIAELVLVLAFDEYAKVAERLGSHLPKIPAAVFAAATCAIVGLGYPHLDVVLISGTIAVAGLVLGSGRIGREVLVDVSAATFPALYLGLSLGGLVATRQRFGREAALLLMATIVASDTAQYYTGRLLGRRQLAPNVSPKKTVEGAVGGLVAGTATLAIGGQWWLASVPLGWRLTLGGLVAIVGIVGDLFESLLKRSAGLKDSSSVIPGHGGMLDRIDALLFAAPVYYVLLKYVG